MAEQYRPVNGGTLVPESVNWKSFLKQLHMSSAVWTLFFVHGLGTGAPTVLVPQIRREWNSSATVDDELASWMYSTTNFSAVPWIFVLPVLTHYVGRKIPFLMSCAAITTAFAVMYSSTAPYHILIAQAIHGFVTASSTTTLLTVISEYSNHRYRSIYVNIQCTTFYWGMWVSNAIGTFVHWKYIMILGLICSLYPITVGFYPESPRWLASKRKFTQCEEAHRWLFGCSPDAEKELRELIYSQADYAKKKHKITCYWILETLKCKQFYMPLFLLILFGAQHNFSGKFICSIYAIEFLKKITKDESTAYMGMLILDGVTVLGMYIGSFLPKFMKLRPLYLKLSVLSIVTMFVFSLYLYLAKLALIQENDFVTVAFLIVYSLAISSGPLILSISIYCEIVSIRYQVISFVTASFIFLVCCTSMLKFTPIIFKQFEMHGSFLFYGITSGIATFLVYIYLPETKNKTLVEIEKCFQDEKHMPETETLTKPVKNMTLN